jgi:hypothetical protein
VCASTFWPDRDGRNRIRGDQFLQACQVAVRNRGARVVHDERGFVDSQPVDHLAEPVGGVQRQYPTRADAVQTGHAPGVIDQRFDVLDLALDRIGRCTAAVAAAPPVVGVDGEVRHQLGGQLHVETRPAARLSFLGARLAPRRLLDPLLPDLAVPQLDLIDAAELKGPFKPVPRAIQRMNSTSPLRAGLRRQGAGRGPVQDAGAERRSGCVDDG